MDFLSGHVLTLANSIIGVSLLAMPYCFKQCGIILSILILLISSIISRLSCHYLLKSAIIARRKTFEYLAFHIFGVLGKFTIEIGIIGFLLGTCIAFFVVMGDLAPEIVSELTGTKAGYGMRNTILVLLAVFCVLPMGLLKNVESLSGVSQATIGFYCCLVLKIIVEAFPHICIGDWVHEVNLWQPTGILQCLPIFSMALFCQTQIFEIYQALPNASLDKMNSLITTAVNMCTWTYIFVGTFGYIAFFQKSFTGNILLSFQPSIMSDVMKIGFILSLAFSFPLVIFPCRASLHSLLYKGTAYSNLHDTASTNYIPEGKFRLLTLLIVTVSLVVGILIPNIELVLGLVGSTIGVMICVLFPVTCFICISQKNTNERILAQIMLFVGVTVMVLGTYANLYAFEAAQTMNEEKNMAKDDVVVLPGILEQPKNVQENVNMLALPTTIKLLELPKENVKEPETKKDISKESVKEVRHEPPQPVEPVEPPVSTKPEPVVPAAKSEEVPKVIEKVIQPEKVEKPPQEEAKEPVAVKISVNKNESQLKPEDINIKTEVKNDEVDIDAIKKEDSELKEQEKESKDANQILLDTIQQQNEMQKEIVQQQKKLIEVIQKQQEIGNQEVKEEKLKAVKNIETIAKEAIERIGAGEADEAGKPKDTPNNTAEEKKNEESKDEAVKTIELMAKKALEKIGNIDDGLNITKNVSNEKKVENIEHKVDAVPELLMKNRDAALNQLNVPIPLAFAKLNNVSNEVKKIKVENITSDDIKILRREILSNDQNRVKREIDSNSIQKIKRAMKEVCKEMTKITSTEKPIIKMLCQLSEPALVSVKMESPQPGAAVVQKSD